CVVSPHRYQAKKNKYPKMIILKTYLRNTARIFIFGSIGGWNMAGSNDNKVNQISLFQSTSRLVEIIVREKVLKRVRLVFSFLLR
ncbi:hypothetical protein, partial [Bacillus toyonensis]|uniref:hypothetical protein n=2 Tax=Bacillus toyonensis TaxID=155322 RepID=UPI001C553485